jgi:hypothetical protein
VLMSLGTTVSGWRTGCSLLYLVDPCNRYPVTADGLLPDFYKQVFDPLETLTFVAAHTSYIALGTSVLDIPFYNPVVLVRRLTMLDVLSGGRLRVGFGLGWLDDRFEAAGSSAAVVSLVRPMPSTGPVTIEWRCRDADGSVSGA